MQSFFHADNEVSDQTARIRRLILVFVGGTSKSTFSDVFCCSGPPSRSELRSEEQSDTWIPVPNRMRDPAQTLASILHIWAHLFKTNDVAS